MSDGFVLMKKGSLSAVLFIFNNCFGQKLGIDK
jgi:hypothetical protein